MKRFLTGWFIVLVAVFGIWGCTQSSGSSNVKEGKIKSLEEKLVKLEDENKSVAIARDQLRKKLAEAEEQKLQLQHELEQLQTVSLKERDDLKAQLATRTTERDNLQVQFDLIRKALRNILNQADAVSASLPQHTASRQGGL